MVKSFLQGGLLMCAMSSPNLMSMTYPKKLVNGDEVRVIAPARSLKLISEDVRLIANKRFAELGLKLTFGVHVEECDEFCSSSVQSRIDDLHEAFQDTNVKAVITVIGGFNSNQLLEFIDWEIIKNNPKIFCGFSDITVLGNAMLAQTGLVSYYGPHYSTFGQKLHFEYTLENFKKALMQDDPYEIVQSGKWSDDLWFKDQKNRVLIESDGFFVINEGECQGTIIGGNITALASLKGTQYFPNMEDTVLFIEDDEEVLPHHFDRLLCSLIQLPGFKGVKGIVIGRFQNASKMTKKLLEKIIKTKYSILKIPVIADANFGHVDPKTTLPIGGRVRIKASKDKTPQIIIEKH